MKRPMARVDGFATLVLPHLDAAYTLARWLMRDAAAAEDVVQDAMLRALRFHADFRGGSPRAWVLRIVRNVAWQALKDRGARREESLAAPDRDAAVELVDGLPGPERSASGRQDLARVADLLAALPPELRECLVLRELDGLSYKEIAEIAEVPVGTVMSRLWRARQAMMVARELSS